MKQCAIPINIRSVLRVAAFIVALCLAGHVTPAQAQPCGGQWLPGDGASDMNGTVRATTMWDPDGAGPQPAVLVAGGDFTTAGGVSASRIARWNGTAWSPLGTGMNNAVEALAVRGLPRATGGQRFRCSRRASPLRRRSSRRGIPASKSTGTRSRHAAPR